MHGLLWLGLTVTTNITYTLLWVFQNVHSKAGHSYLHVLKGGWIGVLVQLETQLHVAIFPLINKTSDFSSHQSPSWKSGLIHLKSGGALRDMELWVDHNGLPGSSPNGLGFLHVTQVAVAGLQGICSSSDQRRVHAKASLPSICTSCAVSVHETSYYKLIDPASWNCLCSRGNAVVLDLVLCD